MFKIKILNNDLIFLKYKKFFLNIIKISLFKKREIFFSILNLYEIYLLNKKYRKSFFPTDSLTFNNNNFSFIYLNLLIIKKKNFRIKSNFFFLIIYNFLHCLLHSQGFKDNNFKNNKIMNIFQNILILKFGFFAECRSRTHNLLITNQLLYQLS